MHHAGAASEEIESSYLSSEMEDSVGMHSKDEEEVAKIMKDMGRKKKKKSRKGTERRVKQEVNSKEDYNDEEEEMEMDEEGNVKEVDINKAQVSKKYEKSVKRRRGGEKEVEKALGKGKEINIEA